MTPPEHDKLLALFDAAADAPVTPPTAHHPADDDETVAAFATDALTPTARRQLLIHLAGCPRCRQRFAEFARDGTFSALGATVPVVARPRLTARPTRWSLVGGVLAASVLVGAMVVWWVRSAPGRELARANDDLVSGRATDALDRLERLPDERLTADERLRRAELAERAGYHLGREALAGRRFEEVADVERRATASGAKSARLTNLSIQASRTDPDEERRMTTATLLEHGVQFDGKHVRLKGPGKKFEVEDRFRQALEQFPNDPTLLTNYGEFLIEKFRYADAVEVFTRAVKVAPESATAHTGLGLALFKQDRPADALRHFSDAERLGHGLSAVNAALCHEAMGDRKQAKECWQRAIPHATSDELKQRIEAALKRE